MVFNILPPSYDVLPTFKTIVTCFIQKETHMINTQRGFNFLAKEDALEMKM
jgi:hypothetical protein